MILKKSLLESLEQTSSKQSRIDPEESAEESSGNPRTSKIGKTNSFLN